MFVVVGQADTTTFPGLEPWESPLLLSDGFHTMLETFACYAECRIPYQRCSICPLL